MRQLTLIVATLFGLAASGAAVAGGGGGCAYGHGKAAAAATQSPIPQVSAPALVKKLGEST